MEQKQLHHSFNSNLITPHGTIIVGFSGGPDSVMLMQQLILLQKEYQLTIVAAHLNHGWQEKSTEFAQFCKKWCEAHLGVVYEEQDLKELKFEASWNGSLEEQGRKARRFWFLELAKKHQASAIALAHHQNDQIETFFIRLMRGASLAGLTGIQEQDGLFIRPLLRLSKQDILDYLGTYQIPYVTDPTNQDNSYLRNHIRNELIPLANHIDKRADQNIIHAMSQLGQADDYITQQVTHTIQTIATDGKINIKAFHALHPFLAHQMLLTMLIKEQTPFTPSTALLKEIMRFITQGTRPRHQLLTHLIIHKNKTHFWFERI